MLRLSEVADGNAGIYQTVEKMRRLVTVPSPRADRLAAELRAQYPRASDWTLAAAVHTWVVGHMTYESDHPDIEELLEPELLLAQIGNRGKGFGDCDDYAMLTAALLYRLHVPLDFVVGSTRSDGVYDHVFVQAHTERGIIPMDGIFSQPFGWWAEGYFTVTEAIPL